jgi:homoserine kinase type II
MAVYTEVTPDDLTQLLDAYDVGSLVSVKGIAEGVSNSNFLLETDQTRYILTLYEQAMAPEDVPFFLNLMQHLAQHGISCPLPVARRDGALSSEVAGRPAALVSFLDGRGVRFPQPDHCAAVGAALAQLHIAGQDFSMHMDNALGHAHWRELYNRNAKQADQVMPDMAREIERELDRLDAAWPQDLPRGIIHADLFPDNVFFQNGQLSGLIDFYFACDDFLAFDLAICLNAWCFEADLTFNLTKSQKMIGAYEAHRPLTAAERDALPLLCTGAAMRFLLTRLHDWLNPVAGALVKPHDPVQYLRRLRFHKNAASLSDYGVTT